MNKPKLLEVVWVMMITRMIAMMMAMRMMTLMKAMMMMVMMMTMVMMVKLALGELIIWFTISHDLPMQVQTPF